MHTRRWSGISVIVAVLILLTASCGASGSSSPAPSAPASSLPASSAPAAGSPGTLSWHSCSAGEGPAGYQCASLRVPVDTGRTGGPTLALGLDRHRATGRRIGSLVVNPGGPGESAVDDLPQIVGMLSPTLTSHFDVVGFDPPGVGHSAPIQCLDSQQLGQYLHLDPDPPGPVGFDQVVAENRTFGQACKTRSGTILGHVSTVDAARDMDLVRQALGEPKLTYLGFSYGTSLGATYAEMFGPKVRAMVLDGAIDPSQPILSFLQAQAVSLDTQFRAFATACQQDASCPWHAGGGGGGDLVAAYEALMTRVRAHPIPVGSRTVGPAELLYGTLIGLYNAQSWPAIYEALAAAEAGDGAPILAAFDQYVQRSPNGTYANTFEAEDAVNCLDDPAPTVGQVKAAVPTFDAAAPVFGLSDLYGELSCSVWPVPATGAPHRISAPEAPAIVVVGSTGDPVTPYAGAQSLATQLNHGVLLTRTGTGHTGYGASSCIRDSVDAYLTSLTVPAKGTTCPSDNS